MPETEILTGGNSNQVLKQGNTVIRQRGRWSPFVHQLLRFLQDQNFTEAPQLLTTTDTTETLTFLEGTVGNYPLDASMLTDEVLIEAAQLLRRFHDVTQDFIVPEDAQFMLATQANNQHEVICHNDFAPYNCVYQDGHIVGIIDFDSASPGSRIWDIAYAIYRFVPLATDKHSEDTGWSKPLNRLARLRLFCDSYGLEARGSLIDTVIQRIEALMQWMHDNDANLEHIPVYVDDLAYIRAHRGLFEAALS